MDYLTSLYPKKKQQIEILDIIFNDKVKENMYKYLNFSKSASNIFKAVSVPTGFSKAPNSIENLVKKQNNKNIENIYKAINNKPVRVGFFTYVFLELKFKNVNFKKVSFKTETDKIFYLLYKRLFSKELIFLLSKKDTGFLHSIYFYTKEDKIKEILMDRKNLNVFIFFDLIRNDFHSKHYKTFVHSFMDSKKSDQIKILSSNDLNKILFLKYLLSEYMINFIKSENKVIIKDLIENILYIDVEEIIKIKAINSILRSLFVLKRVDLFMEYYVNEETLLKRETEEYKIYKFLYDFLLRKEIKGGIRNFQK
ncbi:hypothetical protein SLOPH_1005, partial [Spraguea lophii 42_110]